jgi:hypothetical protein
MTSTEIASASGVANVPHHLSHLVAAGDVVRLDTATGALYGPRGTEAAACHLTATQLRLLIGMPEDGCVRQSDLPSGLRKELRSLLDRGFLEHVGLAAWKSVRLTDAGRAAARPFRANPKFPGGGLLTAYAPITTFLVVLYDLIHPRDAGAYDVLMILGNEDLPPNNRTESAMMWLSRLGYLERHRANGRNHQYRATDKGRSLASTLRPEIGIDNPDDVLAARDACDQRPRRVRATGSWPDISAARVRVYRSTGQEVVPAIEFIAEAGDETVRREANDYGGTETVNYRHLQHAVHARCASACTAAEIARSSGVPVNSVLALLSRMVSDGVLHAVTEAGRPGRLYVARPADPAWSVINRRLLDHMIALREGRPPPRRVADQLLASDLAMADGTGLRLTGTGERAVDALTEEEPHGREAGKR